jgi:CheY-like chemotaxis protein
MEQPYARPLVLVIEDDLAARKLYAMMLAGGGFDVAEAHNGLQAVEKAGDLVPDAIVTDLGLPGIDGFEVCRRLRDDPRTRHIPVLAITGRYCSPEDVVRARRTGCHVVIMKPFEGDALVAHVAHLLDTRCRSSFSA